MEEVTITQVLTSWSFWLVAVVINYVVEAVKNLLYFYAKCLKDKPQVRRSVVMFFTLFLGFLSSFLDIHVGETWEEQLIVGLACSAMSVVLYAVFKELIKGPVQKALGGKIVAGTPEE